MDLDELELYDLYSQDGVERYTQYFESFKQYQPLENQEAESSGPSWGRQTITYMPRQRDVAGEHPKEYYFGDNNNPPKYSERNFRQGIVGCEVDGRQHNKTLDGRRNGCHMTKERVRRVTFEDPWFALALCMYARFKYGVSVFCGFR
ncbi:hypothetical protein Tco_0571784 [Tanacetum coccineum]